MNLNLIIGNRIKELRESKSISLSEMAERSGLDEGQLRHIETSTELPSLAPLIKIARVLGIRLGTLLDDQTDLGPAITRAGKQVERVSFSTNDPGSASHMDYYSLSQHKANRHMEPFIVQVQPLDNASCMVTSSHEGEEFIYCMEGAVEIEYGKNKYVLEAGDSIYYDSIVSHHVHAADERGAKILAVVYTPL